MYKIPKQCIEFQCFLKLHEQYSKSEGRISRVQCAHQFILLFIDFAKEAFGTKNVSHRKMKIELTVNCNGVQIAYRGVESDESEPSYGSNSGPTVHIKYTLFTAVPICTTSIWALPQSLPRSCDSAARKNNSEL